jgi:polysaccharide pyruvyl transferase WcaK-like protein
MKVGLLTFHNTVNHGAALQAYALQQVIREMGKDCEIIDYVNDYRKKCDGLIYRIKKEIKNKKIYLIPKICVGNLLLNFRWKRFLKFYKTYIHQTSKHFSTSDQATELNNDFNKFVVGSDQVWNYNLTKNDGAYFLDFVVGDNRKIAYAASFGLADIPADLKDMYTVNLKRIKHLSVRENYGRELVRRLTGRNVELVLDPVFLLSKYKWLSLCKNISKKSKYIFCYTNKLNQWRDFLTQTKFSTKDYEIYKVSILTIKDFIDPKVKINFCISPIEFVEAIANASLVVSASFHCIAMSIILNVPFVAVLTGDQGKDERLLNILRITGLENRILSEKMTVNDINNSINFLDVEIKLKEYKNKSINFLEKAIFDND